MAINTSASGGPLLPTATNVPPRKLSLTQFLQTVFVGLSNLPGDLVRPTWQLEPPEQPQVATNWMAFGITSNNPEFNAYIESQADTSVIFKRQSHLEVSVIVYGPQAQEITQLIQDGFQLDQNCASLRTALMGFTEVSAATHVPELFNGLWYNRYQFTVSLTAMVQRTYPVLSFVSMSGVVYTNGPDQTIPFSAGE